jgi:hypothetical protein
MIKRRDLIVGAVAVPGAALAAASSDLRSRLLGAWSLIDAVTFGADGSVGPWDGPGGPLTGLIVFSASGLMSVQVAGVRGLLAPGTDMKTRPVAERLSYLDSYYAYFARFEVKAEQSLLRFMITVSLDPSETGLTYVRKAALDGDVLTLTTLDDPDSRPGSFNRLRWRRA